MPGVQLLGVYRPPATPRVLYCSAGAVGGAQNATVETTAPGCDASMCYAARRETSKAAGEARQWTMGPPERPQGGGGERWRVACFRGEGAVVGLVADERFGPRQLRAFAERVAEIARGRVAPVVAACAESPAHANASLAILAREVERGNAERLGHLSPVDGAAACVACGSAFAGRAGRAANCAACGDVFLVGCLDAGSDDEAATCGDCAHMRRTRRRILRLQRAAASAMPPGAADAARSFALRALFDEHAGDGDTLDERGFVELVRAACRHPLVADPRALERELRCEDALRLDADALGLAFRTAAGGAPLDFEAARAALVGACVPPWPPRALEPPVPEEEEEEEEEKPAGLLGGWFGGEPEAPAKTGWGFLVSVDGTQTKRVWLELRLQPPRVLRCAASSQDRTRVVAYLAKVKQVRCDRACELRLRVQGEDLRGVDGAGLRFESPAQCSAWWRALTRAKAAAAHERDVPDDYPGALAALGGTWYRALAATLVCGVDGSPLPGPAFAGPERPFMALAPARHPPRRTPRLPAPAEVRAREVGEERKAEDQLVAELGDSLPERALSVAGPEVKAAYQSLLKVIIRPPRATYDEKRLGVADFAIRSPASAGSRATYVHREDLVVQNDRGLEVRASIWLPRGGGRSKADESKPPPCVVYVHGNACNRLGALALLRPLAVGGIALCALDCAGSGNSGGEFVSLGAGRRGDIASHYERDDVAAVVDELRVRNWVGAVAVWGRSMGAATALLYAATRDPDVAAVVADSAYAGLVRLCRELVARVRRRKSKGAEQGPGGALVQGAVTEAALALVRSSVRHRAGFDVYDVAPLDHVAALRRAATPALLLHGGRDDFISPDHARDLHAAHGGDSQLMLLDVDHQAPRPARATVRACLFVYDRLRDARADDAARAAYAAHLNRLAQDGLLGARDEPGADASGLSRARQEALERQVSDKIVGRLGVKGVF